MLGSSVSCAFWLTDCYCKCVGVPPVCEMLLRWIHSTHYPALPSSTDMNEKVGSTSAAITMHTRYEYLVQGATENKTSSILVEHKMQSLNVH